jgi:8-oxo-dGTP diphosphatase
VNLNVVAAVVAEEDAFLLTERQKGTHLAGLWEFPGGKIAEGESHAEALAREMREELDVDVAVHELLLSTRHDYDDRTVTLHFYRCELRGTPRPVLGQAMRWVPRAELATLGLPPADDELITLLTSSGDR